MKESPIFAMLTSRLAAKVFRTKTKLTCHFTCAVKDEVWDMVKIK